MVIDKPSGLSVHPGAGRPSGTLAHRLLARYPEMAEVGGPGRPGIVHRLDKDTTGVLVAARTPAAYQRLSADFAARRVAKTYLAIVHGVPRAPAGDIAAAIGRHPTRRREMAVRPAGRPARTRWRRLATGPGVALLELDLETGRTHQIRVHLKSIGSPPGRRSGLRRGALAGGAARRPGGAARLPAPGPPRLAPGARPSGERRAHALRSAATGRPPPPLARRSAAVRPRSSKAKSEASSSPSRIKPVEREWPRPRCHPSSPRGKEGQGWKGDGSKSSSAR